MVDQNRNSSRLASLDQFRGYTVLGMFLVNFIGGFAAIPAILKHHNTYLSYADTIMPQFLFAVGFAYRMTLMKRIAAGNRRSAYAHAIWRNLGLILIGVVIYHLDGNFKSWTALESLGVHGFFRTAFQRNVFQALVHIGVTSLWVMPVIAANIATRIVFAAASALLHVGLSHWFYYAWVMKRPGIDGGPLGFLTWTIPLVVGSIAFDLYRNRTSHAPDQASTSPDDALPRHSGGPGPVARMIFWSSVLMLCGYAVSCINRVTPAAGLSIGPRVSVEATGPGRWLVAPPFVPPTQPVNIWTMSQRAGSVSYLLFGAGFSLALYAAFVLMCDRRGWTLGVFRTFGTNALAGYILHDLIAGAMKPFAPRDAPLWFVLAAVAIFLGVCYLFVRSLEANRLYLKL